MTTDSTENATPPNPPHRDTRIPHKFDLNQISISICTVRYREIWVSRLGGFWGCVAIPVERIIWIIWPPKSTTSRNSNSSQIRLEPKSQFECVPRDTEKFEFSKRATNYRALLRKVKNKDKAYCGSSAPCMSDAIECCQKYEWCIWVMSHVFDMRAAARLSHRFRMWMSHELNLWMNHALQKLRGLVVLVFVRAGVVQERSICVHVHIHMCPCAHVYVSMCICICVHV